MSSATSSSCASAVSHAESPTGTRCSSVNSSEAKSLSLTGHCLRAGCRIRTDGLSFTRALLYQTELTRPPTEGTRSSDRLDDRGHSPTTAVRRRRERRRPLQGASLREGNKMASPPLQVTHHGGLAQAVSALRRAIWGSSLRLMRCSALSMDFTWRPSMSAICW